MSFPPPAFLINLARSPDRLKAAAAQLHEAGIPFARYEAVDGGKVDRATVPDATEWCKRYCTDAMLGCTLSHLGIWRRVAAQRLPRALVVEDDVRLVPGFRARLHAALGQVPADYDVLFLGCFGFCSPGGSVVGPLVKALTGRDARTISRNIFVPAWPAGTHCYVVSAQGARKLAGAKAGYHVDMQVSATPGLNLYAASPPLAFQTAMNESTMNELGFPESVNALLAGLPPGGHGVPLAYYVNAPVAQLPLGLRVNAWLFLFLVLGLARVPPVWMGGFLALEAVIGDPGVQMAGCAVAYVLGYKLK
jgi:GR25 family glycosyltransferase involved in LPS biosynthesis